MSTIRPTTPPDGSAGDTAPGTSWDADSAGGPPAFHLQGNYGPVAEEVTLTDLAVRGSLPDGLAGTFVRNGPNPHDGWSPHWFTGDGMVHGVRIEHGRACWYRNRYVRTRSLTEGAPFVGPDLVVDRTAGKANTHVIRHARRILALEEASLPYELTDTLDTIGPYDFEGRLDTAMTAHPKTCPTTGELHFFGYGFTPPYLTYHVADRAGRLVTSRVVDVPGPTMMHDVNLTERFVVFMDLPAVFDLNRALAGTMPFTFDPSYGARLGVLRRDDPHGAVRWFDVEPCYVFHALNAHDDGDRITVDVVRHQGLWGAGGPPALWRWTIDLVAGTVTEAALDDRPCEFPRVDDRLTGRPARHGWVTCTPGDRRPDGGGSIVVHDLVAGAAVEHRFGPGRVPAEAVFAPADRRPGGPGWLVTFVYDAARDASDLVLLDAEEPAAPPVATVALPVRVPYGFHGSWLADDASP
ncbi:MAG: carotenoid oxygenase family protein [Acidimicrobiales bacterium]|nr:carotenoid oxygenase family protein [Acidimicrobiales bacterium]